MDNLGVNYRVSNFSKENYSHNLASKNVQFYTCNPESRVLPLRLIITIKSSEC